MAVDKYYEIDFINEKGICETVKTSCIIDAERIFSQLNGKSLCVLEKKPSSLSIKTLRSSTPKIIYTD